MISVKKSWIDRYPESIYRFQIKHATRRFFTDILKYTSLNNTVVFFTVSMTVTTKRIFAGT